MVALRVALVGPEFEENLGLRYLHAALAKAGHEARVFDFRDRSQIEEVAAAIREWRADVAGLSMMFTRRSREFVDLAAELRQAGFAGHLTAGGHFASLHARDLLRDCPALDSVVVGEGEEALVELLENLDRPSAVAGVASRLSDGAFAPASPRPPPDDLGARAWPTRDEKLDRILGLPLCDMASGRGCWADCRFCSIGAWHQAIGGKRFRQRAVEDVAAEMADLHGRLGARIFNFTDDNFFLPDKGRSAARFAALRRALDQRGVGRVALQVKARPDCVDAQVLDALGALGVFRIFLGIESASSRSLAALGRKTSAEQNRQALKQVVEAGFHVSYNLLMFEPETTLEDVRENLAFLREFPQVPMGFCRTEVYGGTAMERELRERGALLGDYLGYDYRIADEAAEKVYRWQHEVFATRAFDLEKGMGPRSMALDHQLHLLQHFWPERVPASLRERVKDFTARLNLHTASVLEEMCEVASSGAGEAAQADRLRAWKADAEAFDRRMDSASKRLFVEMNGLAKVPGAVAAFRFPWAETGVVCALLFVAAFAVVTIFGQNIRALFAVSTELAGEAPPSPPPGPAGRKPVSDFEE